MGALLGFAVHLQGHEKPGQSIKANLIPQEKKMDAYLMVFHKDETHGLYMAVSYDGYTFTALNDGAPVIAGDTIPQGNFGYKDNMTADTLDYRWFGLRIPIDSVAKTTKYGLQFIPNEFNITHDRPLSGAWTRQIHTDFSFSAKMTYLPRNEKDLAGIACIQSSKCNYVFGVTCKGKEYWLVLQRNAKGNGNIVVSHPLEYNARINLKVSARNDEYQFSYSLDGGKTYIDFGKPQSGDILSTDVAGGFVGNMLGLYSTANNNAIPQ